MLARKDVLCPLISVACLQVLLMLGIIILLTVSGIGLIGHCYHHVQDISDLLLDERPGGCLEEVFNGVQNSQTYSFLYFLMDSGDTTLNTVLSSVVFVIVGFGSTMVYSVSAMLPCLK